MADNILFANNASALLAATISSSDTTIQLASGFGVNFPSPTGNQYFDMTLEDDAGNIEIVKITGRSGDNLTMDSVADRAQDGTTAQAFTLNVTRCELRLVAIVVEEFLQKNGGAMTGDIDMNTNSITDAVLDGASTQITAGEIVNVPLRGLAGTATNEIAVPTNGTSRATAGGAALLAQGDDIVAELDTAGVIILDSATVGVRIPASAYLRVEGSTSGHYFEITHDDTDVNIGLGTVTEINIPGTINLTGDLKLNENELSDVQIVDFGIKEQSVTALATTDLDYSLGSYVNLDLDVNITSLTFSNLPSVGVLTFRLKVTQNAGGETITWPASFKWPSAGTEPTLSTGAGEIDFVDIWSDDGGTTWYGAYNVDWQTP